MSLSGATGAEGFGGGVAAMVEAGFVGGVVAVEAGFGGDVAVVAGADFGGVVPATAGAGFDGIVPAAAGAGFDGVVPTAAGPGFDGVVAATAGVVEGVDTTDDGRVSGGAAVACEVDTGRGVADAVVPAAGEPERGDRRRLCPG